MTATQAQTEQQELPERRAGDDRTVSIFRAGKLSREDGTEELCVVRNVSGGGAMLAHNGQFAEGERVQLDLRLDERLPARIVWVKDDRCGLEFDTPVDLAEILAAHEGELMRPRPPRLRVVAATRLAIGGTEYPAQLRDISRTGACFAIDEARLPRAPECRALLTGLGDYRAIVCWRRGGFIGVNFASTLQMWPLNDWVRAQR